MLAALWPWSAGKRGPVWALPPQEPASGQSPADARGRTCRWQLRTAPTRFLPPSPPRPCSGVSSFQRNLASSLGCSWPGLLGEGGAGRTGPRDAPARALSLLARRSAVFTHSSSPSLSRAFLYWVLCCWPLRIGRGAHGFLIPAFLEVSGGRDRHKTYRGKKMGSEELTFNPP